MSKQICLSLALLLALVFTLPATPAFCAETAEVIMHVENHSNNTVFFDISPWSYTSWDEEITLSSGKSVDLFHTETLKAGAATIEYLLFVSRKSGDATCQFAYRFEHDGSGQLVLSEPEFRNCQFDSSISRTARKEGNKMYVRIVIK